MTVEDLLTDLYNSLGRNTELNPLTPAGAFDISSSGAQTMLKWLNRGYRVMAAWRRPDGTTLQLPKSYDTLFFQSVIVEGTVSAAANGTVTLDSSAGANADQYNGWLVSIDSGTGAGQVRMITDYTDTKIASVHANWNTNPDSTSEYTLYKRFMKLLNSGDAGASENITQSPSDCVLNPLKITDVEGEYELAYGGRTTSWPGNITAEGTPMQWVLYGSTIYFEYARKESAWYLLEYEKQLPALTGASDEPDMPESWQEMLFLWLLWKGRIWTHEPKAAYGAKQDLFDFSNRMKLPGEDLMIREDVGMSPELEG